ncbi:stage II sporulation protein D [Pelagirhabdus alkalitolerans]|uniref:Stage II sporulation protein D n=1 Tax=Pelagirhabdus alkalitolerans TaxID=1612202 RepID=A0A1G6GHG5_9BACI|nr:stage II sporulation protein D [Pelagirhabdus alkalitolerans]
MLKYAAITLFVILIFSFFVPSTIVLLSQKQAENEGDMTSDKDEEHDVHTVSVVRANDTIKELPLEEYVAHVVASEMPADFEKEALKAQAVAARTYVLSHQLNHQGEPITDTVNHQVYKSHDQLKEVLGASYQSHLNKMTEAAQETSGEVILFDDEPITPLYFSTSNGQTENPEDYWQQPLPYLKSVDSPWDTDSPKYSDQLIMTTEELESKLDLVIHDPTLEPVMTYTESGRVESIEWQDEQFTGREIRERLELPSTDFEINYQDEHYIITSKGYGHGVGMSQYGANGMAEEGYNYRDILNHYYQDIKIEKMDLDSFNL